MSGRAWTPVLAVATAAAQPFSRCGSNGGCGNALMGHPREALRMGMGAPLGCGMGHALVDLFGGIQW